MLKTSILRTAVSLARKSGLANVTRLQVSRIAHVGKGTVNYHFGTMERLRTAVVDFAIENEDLDVLAKAWVSHQSILMSRLSPALKDLVAKHLTK